MQATALYQTQHRRLIHLILILGPLPSIFGLHIATYILCDLAGKPIVNPLPIKGRRKLYERIYRDLLRREERIVGHALKYVCAAAHGSREPSSDLTAILFSSRLPIDEDDVGLLFEDIHRGRSVVPPHAVPSRPALVRWDPLQPVGLENLVVMEDKDADQHVKECFGASADSPKKLPEELWGHETAEVVARRAEEIRRDREWIM